MMLPSRDRRTASLRPRPLLAVESSDRVVSPAEPLRIATSGHDRCGKLLSRPPAPGQGDHRFGYSELWPLRQRARWCRRRADVPSAAAQRSSLGPVILRMKLTRPLLRSDHVARPDLVDRLQAGGNRRLTLLAAPLGFGKTTLLPEWAGAEPGRAVAWLSLDDDENDPARFFAYVIAALQTAIPHVGDRALATLGMPGAGLITVVLSLLINDLDGVDEPTALVLDDYHVITNAGIRDAVCYLVEHLPEAL